jgi:transcriptional regulator
MAACNFPIRFFVLSLRHLLFFKRKNPAHRRPRPAWSTEKRFLVSRLRSGSRQKTAKEKESIMGKRQPDMIRGTLDMLILKVLSLEPMHGWGISERIQGTSESELQVNQGSLYASLHKLTREGWIRSSWRRTENNRRARYYELTRAGRKQLGVEAENWDRLANAVQSIMALE